MGFYAKLNPVRFPGITSGFPGVHVGVAVKVEVKVNSGQLQTLFGGIKSQMQFAAAKTLTALSYDVQEAIVKKLPKAFDRPTPFTERGVYTRKAEKTNLAAEVYFPESQDNAGKALREYIRPGAEGARARRQKKTEYLLTRMGLLPPGWITVPGSYLKHRLDAFGNVPGSYYKQVIRDLQVKNTKGPPKPRFKGALSRAQNMGVVSEFFCVLPGANTLGKNGGYLPSGVYRHTGKGGKKLLQYFLFIAKAGYKKRLDIKTETLAVIKAKAQGRWNESIGLIGSKFTPR